jgi:hypothetical protein
MKIAGNPKAVIKLCHAAVGSVVRLVSAKLEVDDEPFLVCAVPDVEKRAARARMTQGLYDDQRCLFLVSLTTGLMKERPHLSSRVIIYSEAEVLLGEETPRGAMEDLKKEAELVAIGGSKSTTPADCLADFVTTFVPETGPELLWFERAQRVLASMNSDASR